MLAGYSMEAFTIWKTGHWIRNKEIIFTILHAFLWMVIKPTFLITLVFCPCNRYLLLITITVRFLIMLYKLKTEKNCMESWVREWLMVVTVAAKNWVEVSQSCLSQFATLHQQPKYIKDSRKMRKKTNNDSDSLLLIQPSSLTNINDQVSNKFNHLSFKKQREKYFNVMDMTASRNNILPAVVPF